MLLKTHCIYKFYKELPDFMYDNDPKRQAASGHSQHDDQHAEQHRNQHDAMMVMTGERGWTVCGCCSSAPALSDLAACKCMVDAWRQWHVRCVLSYTAVPSLSGVTSYRVTALPLCCITPHYVSTSGGFCDSKEDGTAFSPQALASNQVHQL